MKGDKYLLALTTTEDEVTKQRVPLFAFPVDVCAAVDNAREVKFTIAAPSGGERTQAFLDTARYDEMIDALLASDGPLTREKIADALGKWVITDDQCKRGIRVGDQFKEVSADDIEAINERLKSRTMVAEGRMPRADFMAQYAPWAKALHYLQSPVTGGSAVAYRLTYEALREVRKGKRVMQEASVVVAKRVARSRESNVAIYADETRGCLMMLTFAFVPAMKEPDDAVLSPVATAAVEDRMLEVARKVVAEMPDAEAWLAEADDRMLALRSELIDKAVEGEGITAPTAVAASNAGTNLMAQLEASLALAKAA